MPPFLLLAIEFENSHDAACIGPKHWSRNNSLQDRFRILTNT